MMHARPILLPSALFMVLVAEAPIIPAAFPATRASPATLATFAPSESKTSSISALWFAGFAPEKDCILLDIARKQQPNITMGSPYIGRYHLPTSLSGSCLIWHSYQDSKEPRRSAERLNLKQDRDLDSAVPGRLSPEALSNKSIARTVVSVTHLFPQSTCLAVRVVPLTLSACGIHGGFDCSQPFTCECQLRLC